MKRMRMKIKIKIKIKIKMKKRMLSNDEVYDDKMQKAFAILTGRFCSGDERRQGR